MPRKAESYSPYIRYERGYVSDYPVAAPLRDSGGQVYNVKSYGAEGDGSTDDIDAIDAAIAAAADGGGGLVYFPKGAYVISRTILIKAHGVYLKGAGFATTFADQVAQQPGINGLSRIVAKSTFTTLTPLIQFGELATSKMWTNGGVENLLLVGTGGVTAPGHGVSILNVQAVRVMNCGITKVNSAVYIDSDQSGGLSNCLVEHNILYSNYGIAVDLEGGSQENFVRFNYITGFYKYGIYVNGHGNTLFNNYLESGSKLGSGYRDGAAIYCASNRTFVIDNEILNSPRDGIYISGSDINVFGNTITDVNSANDADGAGIFIEGSLTGVLIAGNVLRDHNSKMKYGIRDHSDTAGGVIVGINHVIGATLASYSSPGGVLGDVNIMSRLVAAKLNTPTATPASAAAAGTAGDIAWDASYIYICTATNTWKRVAIATW